MLDTLKTITQSESRKDQTATTAENPENLSIPQKKSWPKSNSDDTAVKSSNKESHSKTLIIDDSILKGINKRGLSDNTDIKSISGAKVTQVSYSVRNLNLHEYGTFINYVDGNNAVSGNVDDVYTELKEAIKTLQYRNNTVYLCTLAPRSDCDVAPVNAQLMKLSRDMNLNLIDIHISFVYANGNVASHYFSRDGVQINNRGSRTLVSCINRNEPIIKLQKIRRGIQHIILTGGCTAQNEQPFNA